MPKARTTTPKAPPSAVEAAARLLGHRPRSRAALARLLRERGHSEAEASAAVARMERLKFLKEDEYASDLARALLAAGHAPEGVLARIVAKEVDEATAQRALAAAREALGWSPLEAARELVRKKRVQGPKAMRLLLSRGFDEDVARKVSGVEHE
jgi:SOS response regulatory protein OraA/RecX